MFGYLQPDKPEMKLREYDLYRAHYCGVCRAISRSYSRIWCSTLTFEAALLALCAAASDSSNESIERRRCMVNPFKKINMCIGSAEAYAADVNIFLAYKKCDDNWRDERSFLGGSGKLFLSRSFKKSSARLGGVAQEAVSRLDALYDLEKEGCDEIDAPSLEFGRALSALLRGAPASKKDKEILDWIGYNIGRWLYLIDAWDDLEEDEKSGSYNVLLKCFGSSEVAKQQCERVEYNLLQSLSEAGKAVDLMNENERTAILLNVIDGGAAKRTAMALYCENCDKRKKFLVRREAL